MLSEPLKDGIHDTDRTWLFTSSRIPQYNFAYCCFQACSYEFMSSLPHRHMRVFVFITILCATYY